MKTTDRHITCQMCGTKFTGHFMRKFCDSCKVKADRKRKLESYHRRKHIYLEGRKQWRKDNPELAKEKDREHRKRNHASVKRAQVNFHKRSPDAHSKYHIKYIARMKAEEPEKLAAQRREGLRVERAISSTGTRSMPTRGSGATPQTTRHEERTPYFLVPARKR
mgnify:CR=1 FL=1